MQNKKNLTIIGATLLTTSLYGGFDFGGNGGGCEGGNGNFQQQIESYNGDYEKVVTVGEIPKDLQGVNISLKSDEDVDIRLYDKNGQKIVHWPHGLLNGHTYASTNYNGVTIEYSGYNGDGTGLGHEYIKISGTTQNDFIMKAFGYKSGYAMVDYSWTGKENCKSTPSESGSGDFQQQIVQSDIVTVGDIPPGVNNLHITLKSNEDVDIQLYDKDSGKKIVHWPDGILSGHAKQTTTYEGMTIEWSGYNGDGTGLGHEYIKITGKTTKNLTMKAYGYKAGYAQIHYEWGGGSNTTPLNLNPRDETKDIHKKECSFYDVPTGEWYYNYVTSLCQAGVIQGSSDTNYQYYEPNKTTNWAEVTKVAELASDYDQTKNTCSLAKYKVSEELWYKCYVDIAQTKGFHNAHDTEMTRGDVLRYFAKVFWNESFLTNQQAGNFMFQKGVIHGEAGNGIIDAKYLNKKMNKAELAKVAQNCSAISKKILNITGTKRTLPYDLIRANPAKDVKRNVKLASECTSMNDNDFLLAILQNTEGKCTAAQLYQVFTNMFIMPESLIPERIDESLTGNQLREKIVETAKETVGTRGPFVNQTDTSDLTHVRTIIGVDVDPAIKSADDFCDKYEERGLLEKGDTGKAGDVICYEETTPGTRGEGHVAIVKDDEGKEEIGVVNINQPVSTREIDNANVRGSISAENIREQQ